MELKEIKEVLDAEDLELIESILIRKKEQNLKEIRHLQIKQEAINRTIDRLKHSVSVRFTDLMMVICVTGKSQVNLTPNSIGLFRRTFFVCLLIFFLNFRSISYTCCFLRYFDCIGIVARKNRLQ